MRVWNYQRRLLVVAAEMMADVLAVALHPAGTLLAVGMADRLRLFTILKEELDPIAEINTKRCRIIKFTNGEKLMKGLAFALTTGGRAEPFV